jgi:lipopolysaccharide transport system permease protein
VNGTVSIAWVLARRELRARYRESILGLSWLLILPLLMASLYTLVFWGVFQARWPAAAEIAAPGGAQQALMFGAKLFAGLSVFQFFADLLSRATRSITDNAPLVKRLQFPVAALVLGQVISGAVSLCISLACCVVVAIAFFGLSPNFFLLVILIFVCCVIGYGFALILAALSTYLRDLQQVTPALMGALLFISPVFYPSSRVSGILGTLVELNPLSIPIELTRAAVFSEPIAVSGYSQSTLLLYSFVALMICGFGIWFFRRLKSGFADLI